MQTLASLSKEQDKKKDFHSDHFTYMPQIDLYWAVTCRFQPINLIDAFKHTLTELTEFHVAICQWTVVYHRHLRSDNPIQEANRVNWGELDIN